MLCPEVVVIEAVNYHAGMGSTLRKKNNPVIIVVYPETDSLEVLQDQQSYITSIDSLISVITDVATGNQS